MPGLFSRMRGKDGQGKHKSKKGSNLGGLNQQPPTKPQWDDAYARTSVEPEEIQDLVKRCTEELKSRALDHPFLLLPFRPTSDPSAVRTFVRHFFDGNQNLRGDTLAQELRMTEPMVLSGVLKWCWSRLPGGVVGWDAYELFKVGEVDSSMARDSFSTFIPLSVENQAKSHIIFDYFDLLSAVAAHSKTNGFGGRKLSRMAAWWAFEHKDNGSGFDGGYRAWLSAADATSHLFFAYLRSLSPQQSRGGISMLPMSLQKLLQETEYPPQRPSLMQSSTNRVVMIVDTVSPTPFALLRRASHFQYRADDRALHAFSEYEDPVKALTEECRRVLKAISLANQSQVSNAKHSTSLRDASWSRFEDIGFGGAMDEEDEDEANTRATQQRQAGLRSTPASGNNLGRPTTPSWADFLSSGFVDDSPNSPTNLLLPPDKVLPPIDANVRQRSSQSHRPRLESNQQLEPGELASITLFELDDAFWWVWISSLAPEETPDRKAAFGRCAVIETVIRTGRWLVMEEMIKGAAPEPEAGAYIAEKKGFFSWTRRNKDKGVSRRKSTGKPPFAKDHLGPGAGLGGLSKTSIGPDQQAKIQAAAQQLQARQNQEKMGMGPGGLPERRGRSDADMVRDKTNSVMTMQTAVISEASPAMKWASKYDKETLRLDYLSNADAGRGVPQEHKTNGQNGHLSETGANGHVPETPVQPPAVQSPLPAVPEPSRQMDSPPPRKPVPTEKDLEVPQPQESHPAMGNKDRDSPLPPPPRDEVVEAETSRQNMLSPAPAPDMSPESKKQRKLHKEEKEKKSGGGFRKLFGRKNRSSKLPENAASDVNNMLAADKATGASALAETTLQPVPSQTTLDTTAESIIEEEDGERTPTMPEPQVPIHEPGYDPSEDDDASRINTADADEAHHEFSRFDQGPLTEQPAYTPERETLDEEDDDATPPPIARHASPQPPEKAPEAPAQHESAPSPTVPLQDRWAQIRKNAADRVKQGDESSGHPAKTEDGDTSGEETIESRVARIKARVAELTTNMQDTSAPGNQPPSITRR